MSENRIDQLREMLAGAPGDRDLRYFLATECFQIGRFEEALEHLGRYFETGDDEGMGYKMRGTCLFRLGKREAALSCLEEGIRAALRHHHSDLAADIEETLAQLFPRR